MISVAGRMSFGEGRQNGLSRPIPSSTCACSIPTRRRSHHRRLCSNDGDGGGGGDRRDCGACGSMSCTRVREPHRGCTPKIRRQGHSWKHGCIRRMNRSLSCKTQPVHNASHTEPSRQKPWSSRKQVHNRWGPVRSRSAGSRKQCLCCLRSNLHLLMPARAMRQRLLPSDIESCESRQFLPSKEWIRN